MVQSSAGTAAPNSFRVVQRTMDESLVVALPLPSSASLPQKSLLPSTSAVADTLPTLDRAFWTRLSFTPSLLKIGTLLRSLGLRQVPNSRRVVFRYENVIQLAKAVADVLKRLPTTVEGLIDAAADYKLASLEEDIALLLYRFGDNIWSAEKERPWLLQASEGIAEYRKDLVFGNADDQEILIYYLRLWILVKAFNALRNTNQSRANNIALTSIDKGPRKVSSRHTAGSSRLAQDLQPLAPGNSIEVATDLAARSSVSALETPTLHISNAINMRRTARTSRPRKDLADIDHDSDASAGELSESNEDSAEESLKHYKGKGRAWKKTEADEDPTFLFKGNRKSSKLRTSNVQSQTFPRPRGRPRERKSVKVLPEGSATDDESFEHAVLLADREELMLKRREKETLSTPASALVWAQELSGRKGSQRSRKKYLSEEVVRNSSDESEDDSSIFRRSSIEMTMENPAAPQSQQRHGGKSVRQPAGACDSCQIHHQKCDRKHPECARCVQLGFQCKFGLVPPSTTPLDPTSRRTPMEKQTQLPGTSSHEWDTTDQRARDSTLRLDESDLPLGKDWDEEDWQYFYLRVSGDDTMLATMRSLGLKATPRSRTGFRFTVENFVSLCKDVCEIAGKLSNTFSAAKLIRLAADPSYLDEEIDVALDTYSHLWSEDADRTKLLAPGSDPFYPKHLFYEDDDDRKLLWIHLHRWVFIVALKNIQHTHEARVCDMKKAIHTTVSERTLDPWQLESMYTFEELDAPDTASRPESKVATLTNDHSLNTAPDYTEDLLADPTLQQRETHLLGSVSQMLEKEESAAQDTDLVTAADIRPVTQKLSGRRQKRKDSSVASTEQMYAIRPHKQRRVDRTVPKGHDISALFMSYLENFADPEFDELAALESIAKELPVARDYASGLDTRKTTRLGSTVFTVTLPAWLSYRRGIVEAKRQMAAMQPVKKAPSRQVAIMERNRLATHLRRTQEAFLEAGLSDLRPEQVIYRAMTALMDEHGNSQTAEGIRRGFKRMEDEFTGLGDELMREGGARYVMAGFASVIMLKDLQPHGRAGQ